MKKSEKFIELDNLPEGHKVFIECPRPDGSASYWLGEFLSTTPMEINVSNPCWVADTGERWKFHAGIFDKECQIHVMGKEVIKRLPRWAALVDDWPHDIPEKSIGVTK